MKLERFANWDGIDPVRLLLLRCSCVRLDRLPSSDGIDPLSLLPLRYIYGRLDRLPSSDGIDPVRLLLLKFSPVSLERFPSSDGIDPVRLLLAMASTESSERFPSSGGSVPFSGTGDVALRMKIDTTRCGVPPNVIPSQLDIVVDAFQLRVPVPRRVSFSPQRTSQSATSPVFVIELGTVVPFRHWVNVVCPETSNSNRPETMRIANRIAAAVAAIPHRVGRPDEGG